MLRIIRGKLSTHLCQHCRGIGLVAALAIVPCGCATSRNGVESVRCVNCAGTGTFIVEVENACPSCRGTALGKGRAA
ncbi:MAG: hypothetical protein AB7G28_23350 [Pirellulales bacterium]